MMVKLSRVWNTRMNIWENDICYQEWESDIMQEHIELNLHPEHIKVVQGYFQPSEDPTLERSV
jgi:hypothetical protein